MTSALGRSDDTNLSGTSGNPVRMNMGQIATIAAEALGLRIGPVNQPDWMPVPGAFTGDEKVAIAVAIAMAESGGSIRAHNQQGNDDSYGLWQINMKGGLGPARRAQFGIANNEQLFDPRTNAKAMAKVSFGGRNWLPWSAYTNGSYRRYLPDARKAVENPEAFASGQGEVDTIVGGKLMDWASGIVDDIKAWIGGGILRAGTFVGGAALIIGALVMTAKKGVK
jgi:hypothetical protein